MPNITVTRLALVVAVAALGSGCGGGNDSSSASPSPAPAPTDAAPSKTGRFVDAAAANVGYTCSGVSGVSDANGATDANGQFTYETGQTCTFKIGGVTLGAAAGAAVVTPVSLVPGAVAGTANTKVTNIVRFLMSLDSDGDASNGITIGAAAATALQGKTLDFAASSFDTDAATLVAQAVAGRALVSATAAGAHLDDSLVGLYAGNYACTYRGVVSGADIQLGTVAIAIAGGVITGTGLPTGSTNAFAVGGAIGASGSANLTAGVTSTGAGFTGTFTTDGTTAGTKGSGTWTDPDLGSGTWSCQHS